MGLDHLSQHVVATFLQNAVLTWTKGALAPFPANPPARRVRKGRGAAARSHRSAPAVASGRFGRPVLPAAESRGFWVFCFCFFVAGGGGISIRGGGGRVFALVLL